MYAPVTMVCKNRATRIISGHTTSQKTGASWGKYADFILHINSPLAPNLSEYDHQAKCQQ